MFNKVGIVGLGLIGGSLCKALKNRCNIGKIVALNITEAPLIEAKAEGYINDYSLEIDSTFKDCDIVFICTPVDRIYGYIEKLSNVVSKDCIISDVGSTKAGIYDSIKNIENDITFIGGHPMTGSERSSYNAAKEHLFENAYYILTPSCNVAPNVIDKFKALIEQIGAIPIIISPYEHDYVVAAISHVPHIVASALVNTVKKLDSKDGYMHLLAAGGFKDITRIASSSPDMWQSILNDNKNDILDVLSSLEDVIGELRNSLTNGNKDEIYSYFENAQAYRNSFNTVTPNAFTRRYEISVDVLDRPGSIAIIAVLFSSNGINIKNMSIVNNREAYCGALNFSFDSEEQRQKSVQLLNELNYEVYVKE